MQKRRGEFSVLTWKSEEECLLERGREFQMTGPVYWKDLFPSCLFTDQPAGHLSANPAYGQMSAWFYYCPFQHLVEIVRECLNSWQSRQLCCVELVGNTKCFAARVFIGLLPTMYRKWNSQGQRFYRSVLCCLLFTMGHSGMAVSYKSSVNCDINHVWKKHTPKNKTKTGRHSAAYVLHKCSVVCVINHKPKTESSGAWVLLMYVFCVVLLTLHWWWKYRSRGFTQVVSVPCYVSECFAQMSKEQMLLKFVDAEFFSTVESCWKLP